MLLSAYATILGQYKQGSSPDSVYEYLHTQWYDQLRRMQSLLLELLLQSARLAKPEAVDLWRTAILCFASMVMFELIRVDEARLFHSRRRGKLMYSGA